MGAETILDDPDYINANLETKRFIFSRLVAKTPEFANANAETQHAIIEAAGLSESTGAEDSSFSDVSPAPPASVTPPASETKRTTGSQTLQDLKSLSPVQQAGVLGGAAVGMEAGRQELKAAKLPPEPGSPGYKWKTKTGYGKGEGYTVQEVAEAYERAKNKGKISSKISPGRLLGIEGWAEQKKLAEELASKAKLAEGAQKATSLLGKIPLGSTLMGAGAGLEGAQAYEAYQKGDYPLAAIHGVGALGSAASLIPHPATRLGGGALSLLSVPAAEMYKRFKK